MPQAAELTPEHQQTFVAGLEAFLATVETAANAPQFSQVLPAAGVDLRTQANPAGVVEQGLLTPTRRYFEESQAQGEDPTLAGLEGYYESWVYDLGPVTPPAAQTRAGTRAKDPGDLIVGVSDAAVSAAGNELVIDLVLHAERTTNLPISLDSAGNDFGFDLDLSMPTDLTTELDLNLRFGVDLTEGLSPEEAFFVRVTGFSAGLSANLPDIDASARAGFLEVAVVDGTLNLQAGLEVAFGNGGRLTLGDLTAASLGDLISVAPSATSSLIANLPITASLGSFQVADAAVGIGMTDLFGGGALASRPMFRSRQIWPTSSS